MLSEYRVVFYADDVILILRIMIFQVWEYFEFYSSLMVESLFVSDNL